MAQEQPSVQDQYKVKYLDLAASGDVNAIKSVLKVVSNVDLRNEKGWTALMFAARNGHHEVIRVLLDKGSDPYIINNSGQSALDIAQFWNQKSVAELLAPTDSPQSSADGSVGLAAMATNPKPNYFCQSPLDRAAHRRKDSEWLQKKLLDKRTKFVLFADLQPVVVPLPVENPAQKGQLESVRLLDARCNDISELVKSEHVNIFLGVEIPKSQPAGDSTEEVAWFALNFPEISDDDIFKIHPHGTLMGHFPALMQIVEREAGILAQARSLFAWHDRYQYCPTCGSSTSLEEAGYKRTCDRDGCRSKKGVHNTSYPRVDPTVIMAVISPDRRQILLGRGKRFPKSMWSCLAGFMEPGESIEDACRREVLEESGVKVGLVEYHSCQPWPMPASLMIGCLAYAISMDTQVDQEELEEARWFSRQEAIQMLTHTHPQGLFCPPPQAQAHQLIRAWVVRTSNL